MFKREKNQKKTDINKKHNYENIQTCLTEPICLK